MKIVLQYGLVLLTALFSCQRERKTPLKKYIIIIERTSQSLATGKEFREDQIDSVLTVNDESAYDSCMGMLYGARMAETVAEDVIKRSGKKGDFRYLYRKVIGYKLLNDQAEDVVYKIPESTKKRIDSFWLRQNLRP